MSIATAIQNAQGKVANAYTAVSGKGGTLPATQNLSNLPTAINSIQVSSGSVKVEKLRGSSSSGDFPLLYSGTSHGSYTNALNYSKAVTVTSGTYTIWWVNSNHASWYLLATITL